MLNKQKTPRGDGSRTGFKSLHRGEIRQEDDSNFLPAIQEKCVRCPYFPGRGYACNLVPCPFTVRGACEACIHFLPVNEHRNKARCAWTGERLDAGEVQWVRECIGFEKKAGEGLTSAGVSGKVRLPNLDRRSNRLSLLPRNGKSIAAYSAVEAPIVSSGRLSHIGGVQRPHVREAVAAYLGPGSVVPCLFYFPNLEVPHV